MTDLLAPGTTDVDVVCEWLASAPPLDDVATQLRHLRLVQRDVGRVVDLLRQHVAIATGDTQFNTFHEPF